jgi:uncharacterized protein (TIGR02271 family)
MDGTISIPLAEEDASVGVERKTTGRVRVSTVTRSFEEHVVTSVERSGVDVQRVPVDRVVEVAPEIRVDGDVTIIPVLEEVLVIEKRLILKEELHVRRTRGQETIEVPVTLRRQEVMIERDPATPMKTEETDMDTYGSQAYGNRTLTAFFRDRSDAEEAARELAEAGIAQDAIRLVPGKEPDSVAATDVDADRRGFWEALGDFFFPDDDREVYAEGLRRGGYLVTVNAASEDQHSRALDILDDEGTIDVDEWSDTWRADGWVPGSADTGATSTRASQAAGMSEDAFAAERAAGGDDNVIPIVEERLNIGKRDVDSGSVRVRSYVVETPVSETVNLRNENVSVERRSVDRPVADAEAAFVDRTIEAEEYREEPVVSKSAKVTEEVVLKKSESERIEKIDDSVRHTEVEVEDNRSGQTQNAQGQRQGGPDKTW